VTDYVDVGASELLRAFEQFANKIREAFLQPSELSMSPDENDRARFVEALMEVAAFFRMLNVGFADMFFELALAIGDLNVGIVPDLLARSHLKSEREGRRFDSSQLWYVRARVALGLHAYLLLEGRSADGTAKHRPNLMRIAQEIAIKHRELGDLAGEKAKGNLAATIINWRNEFRRKEKKLSKPDGKELKNYLAVYAFVEGKNQLERMVDAREIRHAANICLDVAVQFAKAAKAKRTRRRVLAK
jgi:hypothetical protein